MSYLSGLKMLIVEQEKALRQSHIKQSVLSLKKKTNVCENVFNPWNFDFGIAICDLFYLCDHWTVILRANRSNWILTVGYWCHSQQFVDFYTSNSFMLDFGPELNSSASFYLANAWRFTLHSRVWFAFAFAFALENVCCKLCGFAFVELVKIGLWICVVDFGV